MAKGTTGYSKAAEEFAAAAVAGKEKEKATKPYQVFKDAAGNQWVAFPYSSAPLKRKDGTERTTQDGRPYYADVKVVKDGVKFAFYAVAAPPEEPKSSGVTTYTPREIAAHRFAKGEIDAATFTATIAELDKANA